MPLSDGESEAFARLFEEHHRRVLNYVYRLSGSRHVAEEILQDTFTRAWIHRLDVDSSQTVLPYLLRIARNLWIDRTRRQALRRAVPLEDFKNALVAASDASELEARYEEAVAALDLPEREVFVLSRVSGLKYPEIAEALDVSVKTVEARMTRALGFLRERLKSFLE